MTALHVFPLKPGTKLPAVDDWENRATPDLERIRSRGNYGIACGPSELLVVDLDTHKADGIVAFRQLVDRYAGGVWPDTRQVATPSDGAHLYFATAEGDDFRNTASRLAPGIDTRARGGYVVGPGSSDERGTWELWCDRPIAPVPDWLRALLVDQPAPVVCRTAPTRTGFLERGYSWSGLVATVATAPEGTRNSRLYWAAKRIGIDHRAGRLPEPWQALADLQTTAERAGLAKKAAEDTIESGFYWQE